MKNILVFQTAMDTVMSRLFKELLIPENEVFCLISEKNIARYKKLYPKIHFILAGKEILFENWERIQSGLPTKQIEVIYVPSSTPYFYNYDEVFFLISRMKYCKMALYDCNGNQKNLPYKCHVVRVLEYAAACVWSGICGFLYRLKYMGCRE